MADTIRQRRAHAMRRTLEGGGGWTRERNPKLAALQAAVARCKQERSQDPIYTAVMFAYPGQAPVWVPVEEAATWYDGQDLLWHVSKARYYIPAEDRTVECFAKDWQSWDEDMQTWRLARIGAGAYGGGRVWTRRVK